MYKIVKKRNLNDKVVEFFIEAPFVAKKAKPGQFIILRVSDDGERIPLTIAGVDEEKGLVHIIVQKIGATTIELGEKKEGDFITDFVGPLGKETHIEGIKKACIVGGGVGTAIALPVAKALKKQGSNVTSIIGFKTKDIVILENEFIECSDRVFLVTDDGTYGEKGNVTMPLTKLLEAGEKFDQIIAIGPIPMMKYTTLAAKPFNVPILVSMNPIMIDGTGMCGGCRLSVIENGKKVMKFACVDGPDFDGYTVDFDEAMERAKMYSDFEKHKYEETCNLFNIKG